MFVTLNADSKLAVGMPQTANRPDQGAPNLLPTSRVKCAKFLQSD